MAVKAVSKRLLNISAGELIRVQVHDPLMRPLAASFLYVKKSRLAVIEMAAANGLTLLTKDELNPLQASTFGTGEMLRAALDLGCERILIGIGGSATNDGGLGMAQALGYRFYDADDRLFIHDMSKAGELCLH